MRKIIALVVVVVALMTGFVIYYNLDHSTSKPNVVLIIIDTLRADYLGCCGYHNKEVSPEIDAVAAKGVLFQRVLAQCSWTRPSHGSFLTSRYPRTVGLYKESPQILPDKFVTLAEALHQGGYFTIGATANPHLNKMYNFQQGFDDYFETDVVWELPLGKDNRAGKKIKSKENHFPSAPEIFATVFKAADQHPNEPKFVMMNLMEVHSMRPSYEASVSQVSGDVGEFIDSWMKRPGGENTLFVIMSDHGHSFNEHPDVADSTGHGELLYETQVIVPMIFYHPTGTLQAKVFKQTISNLEMMPTILDYVGVPLPDDLAGKSLVPLLQGRADKTELPEFFMTETKFRNYNKLAVYGSQWKYFRNRDDPPQEGINRLELQARGMSENGIKTDQIAAEPEIVETMAAFMAEWQKRFPEMSSRYSEKKLTQKDIKRLKGLGYLR